MTMPMGVTAELAKAFAAANVEMLALALPYARVVEATPAVLARWNCRREDVVGKTLAKFGAGVLSARYASEDSEHPGSAQVIEVCYTPPLGSARIVSFTSQPWRDGDQDMMLLVGRHMNRAEADEAIQNERRLQLALRSGGYAVWDHDYASRMTVNSPEMYDILGLDHDASQLDFDKFNDRVHPEDRSKTLDEQIRNAPFGADVFQTKYRVLNKAGEYVWIESVAGVIRDPESGKPQKVVGLCRNINEQMLSLEKLSLSERNLRRSQSAAKLGSFVYRIASNTARFSREMVALLGLADAPVQPTLARFEAMIEPGDRERFSEAMELARVGQPVSGIEIAVRLDSGELQYFQCNIDPERNVDGKVESLFATCQCVTERKMLEKKFLQAQKMEAVGQLTGGIAHDFNNLLMVVMGNLQLVEQLVHNDERAVKRIRAAMDAADKGSDLTRRMLAFSRQQTLQAKDVAVNDLVFKIEDLLKQAIGGSVELKIMPSADLWQVRADLSQLETAILNLSINARDAMKPKGGTLIIETANATLDADYCKVNDEATPGDYVVVAVTDTGSGIAPENLERVFQPFFTTKGPEAGSGLGLSMVYGFVKQSGGHVKIYSEVGHGTTVKLYLPRAQRDHVPHPARADDLAAEAAPKKKPLVLVVEDNESVREVAAAMIEEMGFEVLQAANGPEGLKTVEQRLDIDLVLSDVIMAGGMNGPELAARALKLRPSLRVLFMSGYAPGSVRQMQDLPDTIALVNKPFTRKDLTEKVKRALAA
jgi:PAS domain S-box-containing protein